MFTNWRLLAVFCVVPFWVGACDGDSRPFSEAVEVQQFNLQGLEIVPPDNFPTDIFLNINEGIQLGINGINSAGAPVELSAGNRSWSVDEPSFASISKNGFLRALSDGVVNVTVSLGGLTSAAFSVTVADATLLSVNSIEGRSTIERCIPTDYYAMGSFSDNTIRNLNNVNWTVSNSAIAQLINTNGSTTQLNGLNPSDNLTLTASVEGAESGQLALIVADTLRSVVIDSGLPTINLTVGSDRQLVAFGNYTRTVEGQATEPVRLPITENVRWQIDTGPDPITLSNVSGSKGFVTAVSEGNSEISAHCGNEPARLNIIVDETGTATSTDLALRIADQNSSNNEITIPSSAVPGSFDIFAATGASYESGNDISNNMFFQVLSEEPNNIVEVLLEGDRPSTWKINITGSGVASIRAARFNPSGLEKTFIIRVD